MTTRLTKDVAEDRQPRSGGAAMLTLVTVCLNNPTELHRTTQSVQLQTEQPDRYLVVDSSDATHKPTMKKIAEAAGAEYVWVPPEGVYAAMATSAELVDRASWVWWVNSSDWLAGTRSIAVVREAISEAEASSHDWIVGELLRLKRNGPPSVHRCGKTGDEFVRMLRTGRTGFPHPSTIFRHEALSTIRPYSDGFSIASDYGTALRFQAAFGTPLLTKSSLTVHDPTGLTSQHPLRNLIEKSRARARLSVASGVIRESWQLPASVFVAGLNKARGEPSVRAEVQRRATFPLKGNDPFPVPSLRIGDQQDRTTYILSPLHPAGGVETWVSDFVAFTKGTYYLLPRRELPDDKPAPAERAVHGGRKVIQHFARWLPPWVSVIRPLLQTNGRTSAFHAHNLQIALLASVFKRKSPLSYFSHNNFGRQLADSGRAKKGLYFVAEKIVLNRAMQVFSFSPEDHQRISETRPDATLLSSSYNDRFFSGGFQDQAKRHGILWVGRFAPVKNPLLALRAFEVSAAHHEENLTFVGDGPLHQQLTRAIRQSEFADRVSMAGYLETTKLAEAFRTARTLLVTSRSEGAPRTILEALACGTPIVTTQAGDPEGWVARTGGGIVQEDATPEALAESLIRAIQDNQNINTTPFSSQAASVYFPELERRHFAQQDSL